MEDNCPPTPLHVPNERNSKSPSQLTVSSPESDGMKSPSGRYSPGSRCVICLGKLQKKSFTDSCLHEFCFQCLLRWSKVKPECPLCKQPFKSIIHNVRSNHDYDQYHIDRHDPAYVVSEILHSYDFDFMPVDRRFRYRSTMTREYFRELAESFINRSRTAYHHPLPNFVPTPTYHIPPSNRFRGGQERSQGARGGSEFRRSIYEQDLWVQDLVDVTGRYRECTPQFYRENPAQIHRIIPWLNREINSLMNEHESYGAYLLDRIVSLLPQYSIRSREFRQVVEMHFGRRTDHFIHELYTFARSVYDITGFDQNAVYAPNPNYSTEVQEISSSSSGDDSDIEVIGTLEHKGAVTRDRFRRLRCKRGIKNRAESAASSGEPIPGPSGLGNTRLMETVDVCESDKDEVKIIEYVKPEPELVTLSSDDETAPPSTFTTGYSRNSEKEYMPGNRSSEDSTEEDRKSSSHRQRRKRHKNVSEKCKYDLRKAGQRKSFAKSRRNRSGSSTSRDASTCSSSSNSSSSSSKSSDSTCVSRTSSSSDNEPISKLKEKKVTKELEKKFKKSRSPRRDKDWKNFSAKKGKVRSCVVVPQTDGRRRDSSPLVLSDLSGYPSTSEYYRNSQRSEGCVASSYWSYVTNSKEDKTKKRKRSRDRKPSSHSYSKRHRQLSRDSPDDKREIRIGSSSATRSLSPDDCMEINGTSTKSQQ